MSRDVRVRFCALAAGFATVLAAALGPLSAGAAEGPIILAQLPPTPAAIPPDDPLTEVERPVEDELILQMRLGRLILSDGLLGYLHRGGILLPLGEFATTLDFPINTDPATGQAEGWFLDESRTFFLDLARGEVVIEGRRESLARGLAEVHFDDIYVDTTLLSRWFPVDLEFDLSRLVVTVLSREPLPIEERLAREQARSRLGFGAAARPEYPRQQIPRGLIDMPFIDLNTAIDFDSVTGETRSQYTALVTGDFLFMDANLFLSGTDEERLGDARFTIGRTDPDGALLGPLGVSEFSLGDVFTPQLPLIASQTEGRGASVSSFPLYRPSEFDRTTLRGDLPLGWEVELYRNQVLIDSQRSRGDARYEFVDVPLLFGLNVLQLVFFGPQGQRREEVQRFFIGTELIRPGEQYWRVAVNQQGTDTIQLKNDETSGDGPEGDERYLAEYERGITQNLSIAAGFASIPLDDGRHTFGNLGLSTSLLGALWRLTAAVDAAGGTAVEGSVQTNLFGINLFAEHGQFFGFTSERVDGSGDALVSRTNARVDATIPSTILPRIPVSFDGELERRDSGRWDADIRSRAFAFFGGVAASNSVSYSISGGGGTETTTSASGSLLFNMRIDNLVLRGDLDYTIEPLAELTALSVSADRYFGDYLTTSLDVTHSLIGERTTTVSPAVSGDFGGFAIGVGGTYVDDGTYTLGLTVSVGIGREPRSGSLALRPGGMASSGAASIRAFLDRDRNGTFDEGDEPISGVRLARQRDAETDDDGLLFLTGLSSHQPTDLVIDVGSLEDPYWVPVREGVEVVPRPGKTVIVDFPVTATGEVDGTVYLRRGDELREVSNVRLELVDTGGNVAKSVKSEFDGFYLFDLVPPGRYVLRVAPDQVKRLKLQAPPAREIAIEADGNVVSGINLVLERASD